MDSVLLSLHARSVNTLTQRMFARNVHKTPQLAHLHLEEPPLAHILSNLTTTLEFAHAIRLSL